MDLGLSGRRAFVSGSSAGIGFEIAKALAQEGAHVTVNGRDRARAEGAAESLRRAAKGAVDVVAGDLGIDTELDAVARHLESGDYDILVNGAGPFAENRWDTATPADWARSYRENVISAARLSQAAIPAMRRRGRGRIVNIGARATRTPTPTVIAYSAAKAALANLTVSLAQSLPASGITVNMVSPGVVLTPSLKTMFAAREEYRGHPWEDIEPSVTADYAPNPAGRLGQPSDIADAVVFLASDRASYINGIDLPVDGGITGTQ